MAKIRNVEAGRGIAALLVVLFHTSNYYFGGAEYWREDPTHSFFLFGHAGVEFFFVLSGYIMLTVHWRDIGHPERVLSFVRKRIQRIYPFFWIVLALTLALIFAIPSLGQNFYRNPLIIIQSVFLMGEDPLKAVVFVSWTLWHEIVFYGFCALVIAVPRLGIPAFLGWTFACAAVQFAGVETPWPSYLTGFINVLFSFGVVAGIILDRGKIVAPRVLLLAGVVIFIGAGLAADYAGAIPGWILNLLFGVGGALALVGAVQAERDGLLAAPRWMVVLGAASFSIYLTHVLALTFFVKLAAAFGLTKTLPAVIAFVALPLLAVLTGVAIHYAVEVPLLKLAGSIGRSRRQSEA